MTQSDITCYGTLEGRDADGDILCYEITSYPSLGLVSLTNTEIGAFSYTPYHNVTGVDSFSYRIRDEFGNYSDTCSVSINISERIFDEAICDMEEHWAHNAALTMVECGAMSVISENGNLCFDPDENITRAEYLTTIMKALGAGDLKDVKTVFADDDEILDGYGGYVAAAYKLGIVKGKQTENGLIFSPNSIITRAEAAAMLNRILGVAPSEEKDIFSDSKNIPAWAENDMYALASIGIISGSGEFIDPHETVTRAQTAQMLYITKHLYS